ncbi:MAG: sugar phosphate isomerase/epimerase [Labilibaculum sp.]|nr:sugar phosphate isomerase/epimerase family protein [Labilibaculum sp.]MBI9057350.1 sugar phosphate isomerase/epimerase [Labilibaculum sp.]
MKLALNTLVYEVGDKGPDESLRAAVKYGFKYIEYAGIRKGNPLTMTAGQRKEAVQIVKDNGIHSTQMLMVATKDTAHPDPRKRDQVFDYMKACAEYQKELGGRQLLVCWGGGLYELGTTPEQSWMYMLENVGRIAEYCKNEDMHVGIELDPHVYFICNNTYKLAKAVEDIGMPNVYPNIDVGHLVITREGPEQLEKLKSRMIHVHLSETESFAHTNSILGTGAVPFRTYVDKCLELGIEENCAKLGEPCVAGIEMGSEASGAFVKDPDFWVEESLKFLEKELPHVTR